MLPCDTDLYYPYLIGDLSAAEKKAAEKRQGKAALKAITAVKAVVEYCEKAGCRREALLGHFGEGKPDTEYRLVLGRCRYCNMRENCFMIIATLFF